MKIPEQLILVSRESILSKRFDITEEQILDTFKGPELDAAVAMLPTDDEKRFMEIFRSSIPQLARIQRKMSVCLDAEVKELSEDHVVYEYAGKAYRISSPKNAYRICVALEKGSADGFAELCSQGCVSIDGMTKFAIDRDTSIAVDELKLLMKIASKFFFQTYME